MAAALIAKAILGGIGGSLKGAAQGQQSGKVSIGDDLKRMGEAVHDLKSKKDEKKPEEAKAETPKPEEKKALSDYDLKSIYGEISDEIVENFAKISAIDYTYNPEAQDKYGLDSHVDDKEHTGVIAQELENNPATKGVVETNPNGDKVVDTSHLTLANSAVIAELSRRVLALEIVVRELSENKEV